MIYLSAQPDDFYFVWQLELQIRNFSSLGIVKEDYHILIGIDPQKGLSIEFRDLMKKYALLASFYVYRDTRKSKDYMPSLRPHIIRKHFVKFPELEKRCIFYHDSDVIFRELPVSESMFSDDTSYVSDTRSYLDSRYVINRGGRETLEKICSIAGITMQQAIDNDSHCGGAQYLLKHVDKRFWNKIEQRSELIYTTLHDINISRGNELLKYKERRLSEYKGIQAWCADMWAIFYTLIEENRKVRISESMRFCWADSPIEDWYRCSILHYTGNQEHELPIFKKNDYVQCNPLYDWGLRAISPDTCSIKVVEHVYKLRDSQPKANLSDVLFIINQGTEHSGTLAAELLTFHIQSPILLIVEDCKRKDNIASYLHDKVAVCTCDEESEFVEKFRVQGVKDIVRLAPNFIVHPRVLCKVLVLIRESGVNAIVLSAQCFIVDKLMRLMFKKMKEVDLLCCNRGKFIVSEEMPLIEFFQVKAYQTNRTPRIHKTISKFLKGQSFILS